LHLLKDSEQLLVRDEIPGILQDLLPAGDSFLVDEEIRTLGQPCKRPRLDEDSVLLDNLPLREVAQEREWELEEIGEGLLREGVVRADSNDLGIKSLELRVVVPTGRDFFRSGRREVQDVELEHHVLLAQELPQADWISLATWKGEVRGLVPHLHCLRNCPDDQAAQDQDRRK